MPRLCRRLILGIILNPRHLTRRRSFPTFTDSSLVFNVCKEFARSHRVSASGAGCSSSKCPKHGHPARNRAATQVRQKHRENYQGTVAGPQSMHILDRLCLAQSMKMIASTKLAKAQRAMQAGKEYGSANSGAVGISRSICSSTVLQKSSNTHRRKRLQSASYLLSFRRTRVFAVVSTRLSPKPLAARWQIQNKPTPAP